MQFARRIFWVSAFLMVFIVASLMGYYRMITYNTILAPVQDTLETLAQLVEGKPSLVRPARYAREGVTIFKPDHLSGTGLTALQGWFTDGAQVKLIDFQGKVLNRWPLDFYSIWPDPQHVPEDQWPQTPYNFHSQGMHLYPDGSLLASIQSLGMVKMDRCGKVLWTLNERTHHTIEVDERDGSIWVPVSGSNEDIPDTYVIDSKANMLSHSRFGYDHLVYQLNADGKVLNRISLLEALLAADVEDRFFDSFYLNPKGPIHLNDIEIVTKALADKLDGVDEGDLLLSLRQMHMLAIVDRQSGELLWYRVGPWVRQHDPEIDGEGNITIYNNRSSKLVFDGEKPYSNILKYYPENDDFEVLFPKDGEESGHFFSDIMGTHQILANGNIFITETRTGRVFESNDQGQLVWEYIERYKEDFAALIEAGERYPDDYFGNIDWQNCPVILH